MTDNIKLIEKRIQAVVGRLKELAAQRDTAQDEVASLRRELSSVRDGLDRDGDETHAWRERREEAIALIRDTLADLREDGPR